MSNTDNDLHKLGMKLKFVYSLVGLLVGAGCIVAGVILGLAGVVGHTSWTASALGLSTNMTDATPGVIVFVVGIFFVLITRFKVTHVVRQTGDHRATMTDRKQPMDANSKDEESKTTAIEREKVEEPREASPPVRTNYSSTPSGTQSSLSYTSRPKF
jgi:hypothetical protein